MYHAVPVKVTGGRETIGEFDYYPHSAVLRLEASEIESVESTDKGIRIRWKPLTVADGYYIYRKTNSEDWEIFADLS